MKLGVASWYEEMHLPKRKRALGGACAKKTARSTTNYSGRTHFFGNENTEQYANKRRSSPAG
jgi:hypothetical protein